MTASNILVRSNDGIQVLNSISGSFFSEYAKNARFATFSPDGEFLVCLLQDGIVVHALTGAKSKSDPNPTTLNNTTSVSQPYKLPLARTQFVEFSPKSTLLATWEPVSGTETEAENLAFYRLSTGERLIGFTHRKQGCWCPSWSKDEAVAVRLINSELHFYHNNNFGETVHKSTVQKFNDFAIALNKHGTLGPRYLVSTYTKGSKGQPSFVRIYEYSFEKKQLLLTPLENKSFYKDDSVTMIWNSIGTGLLVLVQCDSSSESYYGEQKLHFLGFKDGGKTVPLDKPGPIHSVKWHPSGNQFLVAYGFVPSKVTLFDSECQRLFDFGTGARNFVQFDSFGRLLAICGFGNIRGRIEIWDVERLSNVHRAADALSHPPALVALLDGGDVTDFLFAPDGLNFATAITTPRLRVNNNIKVWTFDGHLIGEHKFKELYSVEWQGVAEGLFEKRPLNYKPVDVQLLLKSDAIANRATNVSGPSQGLPSSITASVPHQSNIAPPSNSAPSTSAGTGGGGGGRYVPPHLRNASSASGSSSAKASSPAPAQLIPGLIMTAPGPSASATSILGTPPSNLAPRFEKKRKNKNKGAVTTNEPTVPSTQIHEEFKLPSHLRSVSSEEPTSPGLPDFSLPMEACPPPLEPSPTEKEQEPRDKSGKGKKGKGKGKRPGIEGNWREQTVNLPPEEPSAPGTKDQSRRKGPNQEKADNNIDANGEVSSKPEKSKSNPFARPPPVNTVASTSEHGVSGADQGDQLSPSNPDDPRHMERRIRKLVDNLKRIDLLKDDVSKGKQLQMNQLEKIAKEGAYREELDHLQKLQQQAPAKA